MDLDLILKIFSLFCFLFEISYAKTYVAISDFKKTFNVEISEMIYI